MTYFASITIPVRVNIFLMQINLHHEITETIIGCCFNVMNELGAGFLEAVYKNALFISLKEHGFKVDVERRFEIIYKGKKIGLYIADLVVEGTVIVELKCCEALAGEHQAQLINYLRASNLPIGLLINFGKARIEHKRIYNPATHLSKESHNLILPRV